MSDKNKKNNGSKTVLIVLIIAAIVVIAGVVAFLVFKKDKDPEPYTYQDFQKTMMTEKIKEIVVEQNKDIPTGTVVVTLESEEVKKLPVEDVSYITEELRKSGINYTLKEVKKENLILSILPSVVILVIFFFFYMYMLRKQMGGFSKKNDHYVANTDVKVRFTDVAGLVEEKTELEEVVSFLKTPEKYDKVGAKIPKGVLLIGPPGTGKTLLAKAIAGESGVPFYQISGSEFEEMYVGIGASRVRNLFKEAKKNAPAIVFIDEIDAVARRRSGNANSSDNTAQTLNQILVEMDGFKKSSNVIVLAATNRVDVLDPAILRAGRFDRKVFFNTPDVGEREAILELHAQNKPLAESVDLHTIAMSTAGFSGADLENLINEAAILAAKAEHAEITQEDINESFIKVGVGTEKNSKIISDKERKVSACHEVGHALLFHFLPDIGPVHLISIIPTGGAGGFTMSLPDSNEMYQTKTFLLQQMTALYGGRIAEELLCGDITTGASQDLKQAMELATAMVTKYGMGDFGNIAFPELPNSEEGRRNVDQSIQKLLSEAELQAKEILEEYKDLLEYCTEELLKKEKITGEEFEQLIQEFPNGHTKESKQD